MHVCNLKYQLSEIKYRIININNLTKGLSGRATLYKIVNFTVNCCVESIILRSDSAYIVW